MLQIFEFIKISNTGNIVISLESSASSAIGKSKSDITRNERTDLKYLFKIPMTKRSKMSIMFDSYIVIIM